MSSHLRLGLPKCVFPVGNSVIFNFCRPLFLLSSFILVCKKKKGIFQNLTFVLKSLANSRSCVYVCVFARSRSRECISICVLLFILHLLWCLICLCNFLTKLIYRSYYKISNLCIWAYENQTSNTWNRQLNIASKFNDIIFRYSLGLTTQVLNFQVKEIKICFEIILTSLACEER